ncbi:MAG: hypothetical protein IKN43_12915, partial [Selenomonadaceae bacterium]|nr:hypothetical protein [Selenomonadaceae bacterium]
LDGSTYKYVKGVTGSAAGESLLISGNDAVVLQAAGENDTLFGAGKGSDTLVSASGMPTYYIVDTGIGDDIAQGFRFGAGSDTDQVLIDKSINYKADLVTASSGMVQIGTGKDLLELEGATGNSALVRYDYGNGDHQGVILADVSDGGGEITFNEVANLIVGQGEKTTLVAGANDDVKAISDDMPAGIGWNSDYIASNVSVVDASASNMGAVNGQDGVDNKVIASTGANIGKVWICGGIGANFTDTGNDTLVASGQGHDEIFVGATMGNDIIQNVASNDKVTFVNTKVSDYGGDINDVITVDAANNTFSAVFDSNGKTTTIKGTVASSMNTTTNLTFHFDDVDYVWNGSKLEQA